MKIATIAALFNIIGCALNIIGNLTNCIWLEWVALGFVLVGFGCALGAIIKVIRW